MDRRAVRRAGLQRVTRVTGWLAAGALVASGAFVALLARPTATSAARTTTPPGPSTSTPAAGGDGTPTTLGGDQGGSVGPALSPPVQVPQATQAPAQVTSGQS
jgi:hypothetical protein